MSKNTWNFLHKFFMADSIIVSVIVPYGNEYLANLWINPLSFTVYGQSSEIQSSQRFWHSNYKIKKEECHCRDVPMNIRYVSIPFNIDFFLLWWLIGHVSLSLFFLSLRVFLLRRWWFGKLIHWEYNLISTAILTLMTFPIQCRYFLPSITAFYRYRWTIGIPTFFRFDHPLSTTWCRCRYLRRY